MNDPVSDDLRSLLHGAVDDVEPDDRLGAIRRATRPRPRRRFGLAVGSLAAAAAVATVVVGVAVVPGLGGDDGDRRTAVDPVDPVAPGGPADPAAVPVYYAGPAPDGPDSPGPVLYRYFAPGGSDPLDLLTSTPTDPDYRTLWPAGSLRSLSAPRDGVVVVGLDPTRRDRPEGVSAAEARLAVQQVVYTVRAVSQDDVGVVFSTGGSPDTAGGAGRVLGLTTTGAAWTAEPPLSVLSHVSISDPAEAAAYGPTDALQARGVANSFENTVFCQLLDADGRSVRDAPTQHEGSWTEEVLHPWRVSVDLGGVDPGRYTLRCATDDPTAGTEGRGQDVDTRTIDVR